MTIARCLVVVLAAQALTGCRAEPPAPPAAPLPAASASARSRPDPVVTSAPESLVAQARAASSRYDELASVESNRLEALDDRLKALARYLPAAADFTRPLSADQRREISERSVTSARPVRAAIQSVITADAALNEARSGMAAMADDLPDHVVARDDQPHYRLAIDYLLKKGVSLRSAYDLVATLPLEPALSPGDRVWLFFDNEYRFATWAATSRAPEPASGEPEVVERLQRELTRVRADNERLRSEGQGSLALARQREQEARQAAEAAARQAKDASAEAGALIDMLAKVEARQRSETSTASFIVGSRKDLERRRVIRGGRLLSFEGAELSQVSLAERAEVVIDASRVQLKSIKRVSLLPEIFVAGTDYVVEQQGASARLRLLKHDKFRRNQFAVVVE
jgi:hypothetical protein